MTDKEVTLEQAISDLENLRINLIFGDEADRMNATTFAAHHFLTALAQIEVARNSLQLARLTAARELAGNL